MKNYLDRKIGYENTSYTKKRKILYVDFGFGIGNELAYEHPCVVIETHFDSMFVVPCSTGQLIRARNNDGSIKKGYMITDETNGFSKETALILHGARWISRRRIVRDTNKKVTSEFFREICREILHIILGNEFHYIGELEAKIRNQSLVLSDIRKKLEGIQKYLNEEEINIGVLPGKIKDIIDKSLV